MSSFKPNISQLFNAAFGFIPATYSIPHKDTENSPAIFKVETKPLEEAKKMSWMGTPIMFPVTFKGGNYNYYNDDGTIGTKSLNDFELPPATITDFRRPKNITRTNLLGANGTVKEVYGFDDWNVRIRGLCLDTPEKTAYEQHVELLQWEKLADSINVVGELFKDKSIFALTFSEVDFRQLQGKQNIIPFEIQAYSDEPLELIL
jgi:hypothetical protein